MGSKPPILNAQFPGLSKDEGSISNRGTRITRLISIWFALQVLFNVIAAIFLALHPLDEPVSWFERLDLTVNTGINAALAVGLWRRTTWAWSTAVWLIPLYWALHAWHLFVPAEGILLWPFLMVDAIIMGYLLGPKGRHALEAPTDRWQRLSLLPSPMFALGLYALLAPIIGMFIAIAGAVGVVVVGWRRAIQNSRFKNQD
jgi:energy-converting hydrogenase Eha subunit A